jgi:hypothetical protein
VEAAVTDNTLLLTFAAVTLGLFAALWGLGSFLQSSLYSELADRLPLRALVGALLLGGFITFWTYANTRAAGQDRYGTLFEFNPMTVTDLTEFDAVRRYRAAAGQEAPEKTVAFKRTGGGRTAPFVEVDDPSRPLNLTTADYVTIALEVKEGETKTRFDADLDDKGRYKSATNKVFRDKRGRYIEFGQTNTPSPIYAPSRGAFAAAVGINVLNFVVWFVVFWPVMRFTLGHSLGLAVVFGGVTMLLLMPLLFEKNQRTQRPAAAAVQKA